MSLIHLFSYSNTTLKDLNFQGRKWSILKRLKSKHIASKLKKTIVLLKNKRLVLHIPPTKPFSFSTLKQMLLQYGMVYLKPVIGLKGKGVMRAEKVEVGYKLRKGRNSLIFKDIQGLYQYVRQNTGSKSYLVQKGIWTLQHNGRPFDLRIMVQKNEKRIWEVTGIVGRVAAPKLIVTNRSQGGKCLSIEGLFKPYIGSEKIPPYKQSLFRLSRIIARELQKTYPAINQLGVDIAVSHDLKPWILEVNTSPAVNPFIQLGNKRMLNRIMRLKQLNEK